MKCKMPSPKRLVLLVLIPCLVALIIWTIIAKYTYQSFNPVARIIPALGSCPPIQQPELHPGAGLAWSRAHYPDQFADENYATVKLKGLEDRPNERFLDVGAHAYSREFLSKFSYTDPKIGQPDVRVRYLRKGEAFTGRLTARGLKPNFAYQMKLRGIFTDRAAFERIGHVGRWRLPGRGTNYTDADYAAYPDKASVESYLLFDFFVTDPNGNVEKDFYADSSLHVLWNATTQHRKRSPLDSTPLLVPLTNCDLKFYANPKPYFLPQEIYTEQEGNNRLPIGAAFLPPGKYAAEMVLTEETFHGYGDAGFWPTVMFGIVQFEVEDKPHRLFKPLWLDGAPVGQPVALDRAVLADIEKTDASADALAGKVVGPEPSVTFAETPELAPGNRYYLRFEAQVRDGSTFVVLVDAGAGWAAARAYAVRSADCSRWRRFEVEITGAVTGTPLRLRILTPPKALTVGIRDVAVYQIAR